MLSVASLVTTSVVFVLCCAEMVKAFKHALLFISAFADLGLHFFFQEFNSGADHERSLARLESGQTGIHRIRRSSSKIGTLLLSDTYRPVQMVAEQCPIKFAREKLCIDIWNGKKKWLHLETTKWKKVLNLQVIDTLGSSHRTLIAWIGEKKPWLRNEQTTLLLKGLNISHHLPIPLQTIFWTAHLLFFNC